MAEYFEFEGVELTKTGGLHGTREAVEAAHDILGDVSGLVFNHPDEKTLYIAGDTIWNEYVVASLAAHSPDVIVLNAGDAQVPGLGSIIMGCEDVKRVHDAAPAATIVASHMEAVNHCVLTRADLADFAAANAMAERLLIPADSEALSF